VTSEAVAQTLTALLPEQAVVVEESVSFGRAFYPGTSTPRRTTGCN
jgi:acetolactate synthase-1/2/3 large subunit